MGRTALHLAASASFAEAIEPLCNAGVKIDACDKEERTALHIAAAKGHEQTVIALIKARSPLDTPDKSDNTPHQISQRYGKTIVSEIIANAIETEKEAGDLDTTAEKDMIEIRASTNSTDRPSVALPSDTRAGQKSWAETARTPASARDTEEKWKLTTLRSNKPEEAGRT